MKITVINGYDKERNLGFFKTIKRMMVDKYIQKHYEVIYYDLFEKEIFACTGCYNCLVKTPGRCQIEDDNENIIKDYIESDLVVWITPITFGSYDFRVKRVMERLLPLFYPSFNKENGLYHYNRRYKKYPNMIVIGILPEANKVDETTVFSLVTKNGISLNCNKSACILLYEHQCDTEIEERLENILNDIREA